MTQPVTTAQETITCTMLAVLLACIPVNLILISTLNITSIYGYLTLAVCTFIVTGYLVPNLTAAWLGRPLDEIMDDTTTVESTLEHTDTSE